VFIALQNSVNNELHIAAKNSHHRAFYTNIREGTFKFLYKPDKGPSGDKTCSLFLTKYLHPIGIIIF
jgi:hypothetical protein